MKEKQNDSEPVQLQMIEVFCRYIKRDGRKIYPKKGKYFHFFILPKVK